MRRAALVGGLVVLLLGAAVLVIPFLTRERDFLASTPQPPPLTYLSFVELRSGQEACLDNAVLDEYSERALFTVGTFGRPPSPLRLTITGDGLRDVRRIPPTYSDNITLSVPVDAPDEPTETTICLRNDGERKIALYGGADRTSRSTTRIDGQPFGANFTIIFAEGEQHSLLARLPLAIERMQAFKPDAPWLAWLLAVLFVIGMPLAVVWAHASGAGADEERSRRRVRAGAGADEGRVRRRGRAGTHADPAPLPAGAHEDEQRS